MKTKLNPTEQRVIGCLIEKSLTTPDLYPLSLNSLTNACNQKSNREPVMSLTEQDVQNALDDLSKRHLVMTQAGHTSRVSKYLHRFCNTEFSDLQLTPQQLGIMCVLLLRGAQTPGEIRTRTNRLCEFDSVAETEAVLNEMIAGEHPIVARLPREPGRRESRYQHCLGDGSTEYSTLEASEEGRVHHFQADDNERQAHDSPFEDRLGEMEETILMLQLEVEELKARLKALTE